jgi:hypothetical protein
MAFWNFIILVIFYLIHGIYNVFFFCRETRESVETTMKKSMSFNPADQGVQSDELSPPVARSNSLLDSLVQSSPPEQPGSRLETGQGNQRGPEREDSSQDLATFLIQRACQNSTLANYFYW